MIDGRKPEIVCIGVQKAGTSWLHETLSSRADIWVPPFKELHFFDHKFVEECRRWAPWHVKKGLEAAREWHLQAHAVPDESYLGYLDRLETQPILNATWYKFVFSRAGKDQMCLDVTPEYCCIPETGIDFFKRFLPTSKLIFIVRKPLDRLMSQIRMIAVRKMGTNNTLPKWSELLEMPALDTRGDYKNIIPPWDERFSNDQLLYLPFGQIKRDPINFLRQVETHCGLKPGAYGQADQIVHQTGALDIPEFVVEELNARSRSQDEFIRKRFGSDFYELTS